MAFFINISRKLLKKLFFKKTINLSLFFNRVLDKNFLDVTVTLDLLF